MRSFANRRLLALAFVSNLVLCGTILGADVQAQSPAAAPQVGQGTTDICSEVSSFFFFFIVFFVPFVVKK